MNNQKGSISIHTENIFPIIKKWLYSDKDIFIRELISNGCDAVNKYKKLISLGEAQGNSDENYKIKVSIDKENSALIFEDNGIGMTAEEVEKYINQVAFSGAEDFFNTYKEKIDEENDIIGHFGLGFYSSFMVSKKVQIDTLSYKEDATPVRWVSEDGLEFELSESDNRKTRGTTITLFLADDSKEFLEEYTVRNIIDKYCSFLPVDIYLETIKTEETKEDEVVDTTPINDTNPLWLKAPKDCTDEEYKEFYRKVFKTFDEPLFWIHLNVDYPFNLKGILYFPKLKNEFELIEGKVKLYNNQVFVADNIKEVIPLNVDYPFNLKGILYFPKLKNEFELIEGKVKLYNNQVFVADNIKEVIPEFLLLLKGVIDCPDLPLNVSRSFLQNDRDVSKISKHIVKKVADKLKSLYKNERENYEKFWDDIQVFIKFGCLKDESFYDKKFWDDIQVFIKFGCLKDESFYDKVKDSILFKTINSQYITLNDYLENCKEKHENKVFYVSNEEQQSQYIKLFKDYGLDAVILDQYITLNDYLENCKEKHENKVFYVSNEEQQSQYIKLFKDYGLDAVILDSTIDNHFISMIEFKNQGVHFNRIDADLSDILKDNDNEDNKEIKTDIENLFKDHFISMIEFKNQGVHFNRIDADLSDILKDNDNEDNKEIKTDIENLFKDVIGDRINNYSVESLKSEDTPAIILISEQSRRMAEMKSQFAGMDFGMSFEEEKTLVINNNSSIVKKLVSLKDDESKKEQVSLICNQIVDIALLSNKELDSKQLDEFIKRNNQLMSMVISL